MYFVYILKSLSQQKSYVGITDNLERRLQEHNGGQSIYTKKYRPWVMIYHESYDTIQKAREREKYLKTSSGRRFLKSLF